MNSRVSKLSRWAADHYKQWTFTETVISRTFGPDQFEFLLGDVFGASCYGSEHASWPELDWVREHGIRPGCTVVDCGANHGFTTVLFSKWTGSDGSVIAIEPMPHNVAILKRNLQLNGIRNVITREVALGAYSGSVKIGQQSNASIITSRTRQKALTVPLVTLDEEVSPDADCFVKIDVEGFEEEVLRGAQRLLRSRPRLAIEVHVAFYPDPKVAKIQTLFDLIGLERYEVFIQKEVDGCIGPYHPARHSPQELAQFEVVHLFCR